MVALPTGKNLDPVVLEKYLCKGPVIIPELYEIAPVFVLLVPIIRGKLFTIFPDVIVKVPLNATDEFISRSPEALSHVTLFKVIAEPEMVWSDVPLNNTVLVPEEIVPSFVRSPATVIVPDKSTTAPDPTIKSVIS